MTELRPRPPCRTPIHERPEVVAWAAELKALFDSVGLSLNTFCRLNPVLDKGTLSRYLNGKRVPQNRWLLDCLFALRAEARTPLTDQAREHLIGLQLAALQVAHPHDYRIRIVTDELGLSVTALRESERHIRRLQTELDDRNRQIADLTAANTHLHDAWNAERTTTQAIIARLHREAADLAAQLHLAQEHRARTEAHRQDLESLLDHLEADPTDDAETTESGQQLSRAVQLLHAPTFASRLQAMHELEQIATEDPGRRLVVHALLLSSLHSAPPPRPESTPHLPVPLHDEPGQTLRQAALGIIRQHLNDTPGLANANLANIDLHGANLEGADLSGTNLTGANLANASLIGVRLVGTVLCDANLNCADLRDADLTGAAFYGARLQGVNLRGANLAGAHLQDGRRASVDLQGANLRGAHLSDADLRGADLDSADLREADLRGTDLSNAKLSKAHLGGADLRKAKLSGSDLHSADLSSAKLPKVNLGGADLRKAKLSGADLRGADLSNAKLGGANLHHADLRGARLDGVDLAGMDLEGALLRGALFEGAVMDGGPEWCESDQAPENPQPPRESPRKTPSVAGNGPLR